MTTSKIHSLQKQLGHVNLLLEEARKKEKADVLAAIREQVKQYGITELELLRAAGFVKDKPKKLPAKYYDPSSGKSWTGRGACPKWLEGKNLDDYLIRAAPEPWWPGENP
ncbi:MULTISPECIES: H-NS histone family protein [Burkholderia]|uniref:Histone n=1 Tax=Burkholderia mayonis TaxID=1385591 RepID=A0A1B4FLT3_9BURK|nr:MULTISPECIES: H-NS histone family protein [Burkholderia]AOJ04631.1 histone [Burkholderia mayonis]KVE41491.1 histone [Burkholderia sp. BDU5]KVE48326.1 histone [Burkholderia mayonis]